MFRKSGGPIDPCTGAARFEKEIDHFDMIDADGHEIEYRSLSRDKLWVEVERDQDTMTSMYMLRRHLLLNVDVPPMGVQNLCPSPTRTEAHTPSSTGP